MAAKVDAEVALAYERLQASYQQSLSYAMDLRALHRRLERASLQALRGLANALEAKDPYTHGHSERVGHWAGRTAMAMKLPGDAPGIVAQAGLLHDIGKIGVPEAVLRKPGPLGPGEWDVMRQHPVIGAQIVAPFEFFAEGARIIRHHHERCDGSGYPDQLLRDDIPLGSRIVAVVDVYDALTSDRPYRRALSLTDALRELEREAGRTLDGSVVEAFLAGRRQG